MKSSHGIFSQNNIGLVLIILATAAILLPRTLGMSYSVKLLFYSMYAPLIILWGYNKARFTWEEIQNQGFRLAVYFLSLALFLLHVLSCLGLFPTTHIEQDMTYFKYLFNRCLIYLDVFLSFACLFFALRDGHRREHGRPL